MKKYPVRNKIWQAKHNIIRDGPLEKWWGGGGNFQLARIFFFRSLLVKNFFFQVNPSARIFIFRQNIAFFWTVKSWFIIYVFVLYKLFYTHNRSKDTGHFNVKSFRKCTHSERGWSHLEWTASLCIFSVPVLWNSSPTAHQNDAILHSPMKTILFSSLTACAEFFFFRVNPSARIFIFRQNIAFF